MSGGAICAVQRITINNVIIGANSTIVDSDFHPSSQDLRESQPNEGPSAPTTIEDDVFIGVNCYILRGVTVGTGSEEELEAL